MFKAKLLGLLGSLSFIVALSSRADSGPSLTEYLARPSAPLQATIAVDGTQSSSVLIKASQGGTLTLTTAQKNIFTLTVPAGALDRDTTITMTSIASFAQPSLTFTTPAVGVQMEPEGLEFLKPVTLTVQLAQAIPQNEIVPVTSSQDGNDLRLNPLSNSAGSSQTFFLNHFSPYVIFGSKTARESILKAVTQFSADRIMSWTADQLMRKKNGQDFDYDFAEKCLEDTLDKVVKPRMNNIESCEGGLDAMNTYFNYLKSRQLITGETTQPLDINLRQNAIHKTAVLCKERAIKACYEDHRPFDVMQLARANLRKNALMDVTNDPIADEMYQLGLKCNHFQFVMDSTFKVQNMPTVFYTAHADVAFWYDDQNFNFQSNGNIQVTQTEYKVPGVSCNFQSLVAPPQPLQIKQFFISDARFDQTLGLFLGIPSPQSLATFLCVTPTSPPMSFTVLVPQPNPQPDYSLWGGSFMAAHSEPHSNELNVQQEQFEIYKWDVLYGDIFAVKKYDRTIRELIENTTMTVFHRPLK